MKERDCNLSTSSQSHQLEEDLKLRHFWMFQGNNYRQTLKLLSDWIRQANIKFLVWLFVLKIGGLWLDNFFLNQTKPKY